MGPERQGERYTVTKWIEKIVCIRTEQSVKHRTAEAD